MNNHYPIFSDLKRTYTKMEVLIDGFTLLLNKFFCIQWMDKFKQFSWDSEIYFSKF